MRRLVLLAFAFLACSSFGFASTENDLKILVSNMQTAILTQDKSAYLEH